MNCLMHIFNSCQNVKTVEEEQPVIGLSQPIEQERINQDLTKPVSEQEKIQRSIKEESLEEGSILCSQEESKEEEEVVIRSPIDQSLLYCGFMFHGMRNGYGIEYDENQNILYEGQWKNNVKDGWGKTQTYQGELRNDQFDGWGRLITHDHIYEGYFRNNHFSGFGIIMRGNYNLKKLKDLEKVDNLYDFISEELRNQRDNLFQTYQIKQIYLGDWVNGYMQGFGQLFELDSEFEGQFAKNKPHGNGVLRKKLQKNNHHQVKKGFFIMGALKE